MSAKKMKPYQTEWLESEVVINFLRDFRGSRGDITDEMKKCLTGYAFNYHYSRRSLLVKWKWILLLAMLVLRLFSAALKRACIESLSKGQYIWFSFYCVGEIAAMIGIVLAALIRQRSTFTRNFWLSFCLLVGIISDTVPGAFSNGGNSETVERLNYASVGFKTAFEILKNAPACVLLCGNVVGMKGSATPPKWWDLLKNTPSVVNGFEYLLEGERAWAYKALMDKLCEDPRPRAKDDPNPRARDDEGESSGFEKHDILSFMRPLQRPRSPETLLPV